MKSTEKTLQLRNHFISENYIKHFFSTSHSNWYSCFCSIRCSKDCSFQLVEAIVFVIIFCIKYYSNDYQSFMQCDKDRIKNAKFSSCTYSKIRQKHIYLDLLSISIEYNSNGQPKHYDMTISNIAYPNISDIIKNDTTISLRSTKSYDILLCYVFTNLIIY